MVNAPSQATFSYLATNLRKKIFLVATKNYTLQQIYCITCAGLIRLPIHIHTMLKEFKDFIMRGNVLELATAVIIAGAFGAVVTSFTNDVLMPPIGQALGGVNFSDLAIPLADAQLDADGNVVKEAAAIRYGAFIQTIIDFVIIAFIVFMIIRAYNRLNTQPEPEPAAPAGPSETDLLAEIRDLLKK